MSAVWKSPGRRHSDAARGKSRSQPERDERPLPRGPKSVGTCIDSRNVSSDGLLLRAIEERPVHQENCTR
jgi:hypothetical protein